MARGRKKGGININSINDTNELTKMVINQINSLNKKIKAFKADEIEEHAEYVKKLLTDDMVKYTDKGTISKSKNFYSGKNKVWLKKTLSALHKINNHDIFGTTTKYKNVVTKQLKAVKQYAEEYLRKKGYSEQFIFEVINSKDFYIKLFDAFGDSKGYESNQTLEKVALNYSDNGLSDKEKDKILNNIEHSQNTLKRIREEQDAFQEFQRMRNGKMR